MAIDLGELTGNAEQKALDGHAKIKELSGEILALDIELNGVEDPEKRAAHDIIMAMTVETFLQKCMKRGFNDWLNDFVAIKTQTQTEIDHQDNSEAVQDTQNEDAVDRGEVNDIVDGL